MFKYTVKKQDVIHQIESMRGYRSKYDRAVRDDSIDLLCEMPDELPVCETELNDLLLNGSADWQEFSANGNALIFDEDIAKRYLTAAQMKEYESGDIDVIHLQGEALYKASRIVWVAVQAANYDSPRMQLVRKWASHYSDRTGDLISYSTWCSILVTFAEEYNEVA